MSGRDRLSFCIGIAWIETFCDVLPGFGCLLSGAGQCDRCGTAETQTTRYRGTCLSSIVHKTAIIQSLAWAC